MHTFWSDLRTSLHAFWVVFARVTLEDYLRARLTAWEAMRPQVRHPAPQSFQIVHGDIVITENSRFHRHPLLRLLDDPAGMALGSNDDPDIAEFRSAQASLGAERQQTARELEAAEQQIHSLNAENLIAQEQLENQQRNWIEQLATGQLAVPQTQARNPQQRGRPTLAHAPSRIQGIRGMVALFALIESAQFSVPMADLLGVDPNALWASPLYLVAAALSFGPVIALCLFLLAHHLLERLREIERTGLRRTTTSWVVVGALLLGGTVWALASVRHGLAAGVGALSAVQSSVQVVDHSQTSIFAMFTLVVTVGLALGWEYATQLEQDNNRVRAQQQAWDLAQAQLLESRERQEALLEVARGNLQRLAALQQSAQNRLRQLTTEAQLRERVLRERVEAERHQVEGWARHTRAGLEADRAWFLAWSRWFGRSLARSVRSGFVHPSIAVPGMVAWKTV